MQCQWLTYAVANIRPPPTQQNLALILIPLFCLFICIGEGVYGLNSSWEEKGKAHILTHSGQYRTREILQHALRKSDFLGGLFVFVSAPYPLHLHTHNIRFLSITSFLGSGEPTYLSWDPLPVAFLIFKLLFTFLRKPRWISEA